MPKRKVEDVFREFHTKVPFPVSPKSIRAAGYDVTEYLLDLANQLEACEDYNSPKARRFIDAIEELRQLAKE